VPEGIQLESAAEIVLQKAFCCESLGVNEPAEGTGGHTGNHDFEMMFARQEFALPRKQGDECTPHVPIANQGEVVGAKRHATEQRIRSR
jgi:hypothetical protein